MLTEVAVDFSCDEPCRSVLLARIDAVKEYRAIPGLLKRGAASDPDAAWYVGYYDVTVVHGPNFDGAVLRANGVKFVLPQVHLAQELHGRELAFVDGKFIVRRRTY